MVLGMGYDNCGEEDKSLPLYHEEKDAECSRANKENSYELRKYVWR